MINTGIKDFNNKHAVITGGASGIGLAVCRRLAAVQCRIAIWDINDSAMAAAKEQLTQLGAEVTTWNVDITDKSMVYKTASDLVKCYGPVDILVNNAGCVAAGSIMDQPDEAWERTISINLTSMIYTIRAFLPGMKERNRGWIVNISSAAGVLGVPDLAVYAASKWGVWGLTESLRHEAQNQKLGIHYSSIHPGYIATGLFEGAKIKGLGGLIVPLVKTHDVIARAIVEKALKRGRTLLYRPRSIQIAVGLRGLLPDSLYTAFIRLLGIHKSMSTHQGHGDSSVVVAGVDKGFE